MRLSKIARPVWQLTVLVTIAFGSIMLRPAAAQPVEYVKICSDPGVGNGYYFIPGTDICLNASTNQAEETFGTGPTWTWTWRMPNNPRTWATTPQAACQNGQLVKLADITGTSLTENAYSTYETAHYPLRLAPGQYIASVSYKGGFSGAGTNDGISAGNFCIFYYTDDPANGAIYTPLGCIDTTPQATLPATLSFTPDAPVPPASNDKTYLLGADGDPWTVASAADIQGELSVWLCLQTAPSYGPAY